MTPRQRPRIVVASYYLALRHDGRFCWTTHVCAPYLDQPDAAWFSSGLPVVGYFHDRDTALGGPEWLARWLDGWEALGARRFIDFRELAAAVGRCLYLEKSTSGLRLAVTRKEGPDLVRPIAVKTRVPGQQPECVPVRYIST